MSRSVLPILAGLALSAVCGCAGSSQQAISHSLAAQVPAAQVAAQPPTDFEFEFNHTESSSPRRFTRDAELVNSLHAASPTRTNE
jgi:hypothetical protein